MAHRFLTTLIGVAAIGTVTVSTVYWYLTRPIAHPEATVVIAPGTSVAGMAQQLAATGVLRETISFRCLVRLLGTGRQLKAGEYLFPDGATVLDIYRKLTRGEFRTFRISIPEGWTMREIAAYLERQPFATTGFAQAFLAACQDPTMLKRLELPESAATCEGYLFPETYLLHRPRSAEEVVARLVQEFRRHWTSAMNERATHLGMTVHQVVTLASIVEKETGAAEERPVVASVFHNRLKRGIALASDPTIIYGLPNFDGNLRKADLTNPHPYNTYVHPGLPPGPIANPGLASLDATLNPATSDYLYFVSRNNGTHAFAATYADHVRNVQKYQLHR